MFQITQQQLDDMTLLDEEEFTDFVVSSTERDCAEHVKEIPPYVLREMCIRGISRARRYGFRDPASILTFVFLMFDIAPNFDEQAQINDVLNNPGIEQNKRLDAAINDLPKQAWEDADNNTNFEVWFPELKTQNKEE